MEPTAGSGWSRWAAPPPVLSAKSGTVSTSVGGEAGSTLTSDKQDPYHGVPRKAGDLDSYSIVLQSIAVRGRGGSPDCDAGGLQNARARVGNAPPTGASLRPPRPRRRVGPSSSPRTRPSIPVRPTSRPPRRRSRAALPRPAPSGRPNRPFPSPVPVPHSCAPPCSSCWRSCSTRRSPPLTGIPSRRNRSICSRAPLRSPL